MQGRQFLQLSGFSAAALFFSRLNAESGVYVTLVFDGDSLSVSFLNSVSDAVKKYSEPRKPLSGKLG